MNASQRKFTIGLLISCFIFGAVFTGVFAAQKKAEPATAAALVDLNTATGKELEALPGVGPATAKKLITGRPYAVVSDLSKAGVSAATIPKISPIVKVSAPSAPSPAPVAAQPAPAKTTAPPAGSKAATQAATFQPPPAKGMVWVNTSAKEGSSAGFFMALVGAIIILAVYRFAFSA